MSQAPGYLMTDKQEIFNVTLTNADTEYTFTLPSGTTDRKPYETKHYTMQCRTNYDVRYAFTTGKVASSVAPYMTMKAGSIHYEQYLVSEDEVLYLASSEAGVVVEIKVITSYKK